MLTVQRACDMSDEIEASNVHDWFPPALQKRYVENIVGKVGLTLKQATYFVRLWGYNYLKQSGAKQVPIEVLDCHLKSFYCSHSEAADLFYSETERGSHRSAGMIIDKLVAKKLVKRESFDGSTTRLSLHIPDGFLLPTACLGSDLYADAFNARNDAPIVANILGELYTYDSERPKSMTHHIKKGLRQWAALYPTGMRVIRQKSDGFPVGFASFFPTSPDSEEKFNLPPSESLHLTRLTESDPIKIATVGDLECYAVYIRGWQIQPQLWSHESACLLFQDSQDTLKQMQKDFPNLCEIYSITIHPRLEAFALTLGFKILRSDPSSSLRWLYMPLDRFITLDYYDLLLDFDFSIW